MKEILLTLSLLSIELGDANDFASKEQLKNYWLGFEPAKVEQILKVEKKLNVTLPNDYKQFLKITNGFSAPNSIEPTFLRIEEIDFLTNIDPDIIEAYSIEGIEDIGQQLKKSILVAGKDEEQYFLLIPPTALTQKWKYWKFANWQPGEEEFDNLESYFKNVVEFEKRQMKDKE